MSLNKPVKYIPGKYLSYIQGQGERIIGLLKDVRDSVALLRPDLKNQRLDIVLEVIEEGKWILQEKTDKMNSNIELNYEVDLTIARDIVNNYRNGSEGGCKSCSLRRVYTPMEGERFTYCSKHENEDFAINNWNINNSQSPTIKEFYEKGCDEKEIVFARKLEEILQEHKNE